jgi:hypothetical protein
MPERSQAQIAEGLRRMGQLSPDQIDKLLAHAITELDDVNAHATLLLALAETRPSEPVKQALYYNCNKASDIAVPCAALLCFLAGKATSSFDPALIGLLQKFGLHVNYFDRSAGLEQLRKLTGLDSKEPWDFALIDDPNLPAAGASVTPATPPPSPSAAAPTPGMREPLEMVIPVAVATSPALPVTPPPLPAMASGLARSFDIESEMRGETIHYIEADRRTSMQFFWTRGYQIHADTITSWFYPADKRSLPVTPQQRIDIVGRVVDWARRVQNVKLDVMAEDWMYEQRLKAEIDAIKQQELAVLDSSDQLGVFASLADLWRKRTESLYRAGRIQEAIAAYHRGAMWAWRYAAGATSGGEGAALSRERDNLIRDLRTALGPIDPGDDKDGRLARAAVGESLS